MLSRNLHSNHPSWYENNFHLIEDALERYKPKVATTYAKKLIDSMNYSLFANGKRIRPMLALSTFQALNGQNVDHILMATSSLEMIHTFSLIHDDLPCMDDDSLRRGKPTNHIVYGEGIAVLSGTALCIHAFELIYKTQSLACSRILCTALGIQGMLAGQTADLLNENQTPNLETVHFIHEHKTGKLIEASILLGAELANATDTQKQALKEYGKKIGLAFQIVDDILDLEQSSEHLGKNAGSDSNRQKMTHPETVGIEKSKKNAVQLFEQAIQCLDKATIPSNQLKYLAKLITKRSY